MCPLFGKGSDHSRSLGLPRNEPRSIKGLRALLAYILIIGLIVYSLFVLVLGPVQETELPPVKTFRGASLSDTQFESLDLYVWRIFVVSNIRLSQINIHSIFKQYQLLDARTTQVSNITAANLKASIDVTALWDDKGMTHAPKNDSNGLTGRSRLRPHRSVQL